MMARLKVGHDAPHRLSHSFTGDVQIEFQHPLGAWTSPLRVPHAPQALRLIEPQNDLPIALRHLPESVRAQMMPPQPGVRTPQLANPPVPQAPVIPALPELPEIPLFGRRNYMAGVGLWLSQARLEEQLAMREHPYGYVENNPIRYEDPTGRSGGSAFGLLKGEVIFNGCTSNFINANFCVVPEGSSDGTPITNPGSVPGYYDQNIDGIAFGDMVLKVPDNCTLTITCSAGAIVDLSCSCISLFNQRCEWVKFNKPLDEYYRKLQKCGKPMPPVSSCIKSFIGKPLIPTVPQPPLPPVGIVPIGYK